MLKTARSKSTRSNPVFCPLEREASESNSEWCARVLSEIATGALNEWTHVALLGGSDTMAFRLRVAQSHLRPDMLPSYWSEVILVALKGASILDACAIHVPLNQPGGPAFAPRSNGVIERPLTDFDEVALYPNIALIALPVPQQEVLKRVADFSKSRPTLDALEHVLRWLAFGWGAARSPNPLHENYGLPSACMLETVFAAVNLDITPGLEARASCPEAIWTAALYWQEYYKTFRGEVPKGRHWTPHKYAITEPLDESRRGSATIRSVPTAPVAATQRSSKRKVVLAPPPARTLRRPPKPK